MQNAINVFSGVDFMGSARMEIVLKLFLEWLLKHEAIDDNNLDVCWYMPQTMLDLWSEYIEACGGAIFGGIGHD